MRLINLNGNQEIVKEIHKADTITKKINGLIGKNNPQALYLETRWGIHTFGVKFPLDIIILDSKWRVKKIHESLKPMKIFFWNPIYFRVLELPQDTLKNSKVSLDDVLIIQ